MSYYQKRAVLAKIKDPEICERWHSVLKQFKEKNEDMAPVEDILSEAEKNNGILEFEFEYYSGEAFKEYEELLKEAESSDNGCGVIVKLDSDYGSYISTYGQVESEEFSPRDEQWVTGTFASVTIRMESEKLAVWLECEMEDIEDTLYDREEDLMELLDALEFDDIEIEVESFDEDDDQSTFQLSLGTDFFRYGTIDELNDSFEAIKKMKAKVESMEGSLVLGQPEILLLNDKGECDWISEQGFKELKLESTEDDLGTFVATRFALR